MSGPLLVVDAPFVLYRSFFGLPETIRSSDGQPRNALLGACNLLLRVAAETSPRAVITCFGAEQAPYRVALHGGYHAQRPPMPDALADQWSLAPGLFASFGWQPLDAGELEADDLLGALARAEAAAGGETLILTGDRDLYQCVDDRTRVLYLRQGSAGFETVDEAEVRRRYGVSPALVPDFIALRGDPSDGLPGAPGIGAKTAAALLARHGSLETLLRDVASDDCGERPRIAAILREHSPALRRYREIATLVPLAVERPRDAQTDLRAAAAAAAALGMGNLAGRLESAVSVADLRMR